MVDGARIDAVVNGTVANDSMPTDIVFKTNQANERVRFTNTGRVGIGTATPGALLSIQGGESATPRFAIENTTASTNDFTITQYEDSNGVYSMLGQNVKLDNSGNNSILDSSFRTAAIQLDARNHGSVTVFTGGTNAVSERLRIDSIGTFHFKNGTMIENGIVDTTARTGTQAVNLDNGMVHYFTTTETTTSTPNIISSVGIDTTMSTGDTMAVTIITTAAAAGYSARVSIDGLLTGITTSWVGGSEPSAGGSSGVDIYNYTIIKTGRDTVIKLKGLDRITLENESWHNSNFSFISSNNSRTVRSD